MSVSHIRRCHVCGNVNECEGAAVHKCGQCGKHLAPFYYFDESKLEGLAELGPYLSVWKEIRVPITEEALKAGETFNPIWGLSTYWENHEGQSRGYS